ncbi:MAG: hypothetical protein COV76_00945 [Candidatus Omnitrophica bacterium CG11_big_fil_rev_8_21_14_0_20_64_10]|nr:MAG: hypothetical protein COV76_00945 [Candidatus Omnitrophica bacterium CG11_big_fil_rev_8_21_14_0_20_64_10]
MLADGNRDVNRPALCYSAGMIQFRSLASFEETEAPPLDLAMPQVYRRPRCRSWLRGKQPVPPLLRTFRCAARRSDPAASADAFNRLLGEFQPGLQWAADCWDHLLTTEGIRFLPRSFQEKRFHRGDYRVFTQKDYLRLIHRAFKQMLLRHETERPPLAFPRFLQREFWPTLLTLYGEIRRPPDPAERWLTPYSYLRCTPYRFFHPVHQKTVDRVVSRLQQRLRKTVELYYLRFRQPESAAAALGMTPEGFQEARFLGMRQIARENRLAFKLLRQIERY